jgi:UDP-N-acetylmuramyl pentapeptide phosphotransferase/UDP-N-acetylglucosamine-1-phosphate transferase
MLLSSSWLISCIVLFSALVTAFGISLSLPLFKRLILAQPNERSSHHTPTPQGGGVVIVSVFSAIGILIAYFTPSASGIIVSLIGIAFFLAVIGLLDDRYNLPIYVRLGAQALAVWGFLSLFPEWRLFPFLPVELERFLTLIAGVGWINIVNFMDGIDLMSAAQTVPTAWAVMIASFLGMVPPVFGLVAALLLGVILGFIPFNTPPARLFLGDSGSLPIGFFLGVLLYALAYSSTFSGALLLALYYLADGLSTFFWRLKKKEKVWQAHREHSYQRAIHIYGWPVHYVSGSVFVLNSLLALCAIYIGAKMPSSLLTGLLVTFSIVCTFGLIKRFGKPVHRA